MASIVATKIDFSILCSAKNGTFGTLDMLLSKDVDVIFGPICSTGLSVSTLSVGHHHSSHAAKSADNINNMLCRMLDDVMWASLMAALVFLSVPLL